MTAASDGLAAGEAPADPAREAVTRAALLAAARAQAGPPRGRCLDALRRNLAEPAVVAAGGYEGLRALLDARAVAGDAWRYTASALGLARALEAAGGPAAVGLVRLDVLPPEAPPGALLLLRGTGRPGCLVDPRWGDVSVVDGVAGGAPERPIRAVSAPCAPAPDHEPDASGASGASGTVEASAATGTAGTRGDVAAGPLLAPGDHVQVLASRALPGRSVEDLVARARGPVDAGPPGPTIGWVDRAALAPVPRALVVWSDARALLPGDRAAWRSAAWAGTVVGVFVPG